MADHGTPQGYRDHCESGERACTPCRSAWRNYCRGNVRARAQRRIAARKEA